jgi:protein-disulfide isomerase
MQKVKTEVVVENQLESIPTPAVENAPPAVLEAVIAPLVEPSEPETAVETPPVLVIPRAVFNYVVIAIVFFILGAGVSFVVFTVNNNENRQLIDEAVKSVVAALPENTDTAASGEPNANEQYNVTVGNDPIWGNAEAQVVMIEFSDFNCSFCGRFAKQTLNPLMEAYADRVKFVYRDYPILAQSSLDSALAAQCAYEQDKFWEYHNILFNSQGQFARDFYLQTAKDLELDVDKFTSCLDNQTFRDEVIKDATEAQQLGLRGTPSFFINGRYISGAQPYEVFSKMLDEELAKAANPAAPSGS